MTRYCEKLRTWNLGPDACDGDYANCKCVVKFGNQEYCGYCPGRCGLHQVIKSQAGCLFCKYATKNLYSAKCLPCLSAEIRINYERIEE